MLIDAIGGAYLNDLLDQPSALSRTWERLRDDAPLREVAADVLGGRYRRIMLTGMGSSFHALYPLHLQLTKHGFGSHLAETSELIHYMRETLTPETLVIALSQSGRSAETLSLLDLTRGRTPVIAVTNNEQSALARGAELLLLMHAGSEASVSCKTYVASLMALEWLGAFLTGKDTGEVKDELALAGSAVEQYLESWKLHTRELGRVLRGVRQLFVAGRGPSIAAAGTGGLIVKESVRFPAEGMSCAAFRHGPFEMLQDDVFVAVLAGGERAKVLNRRLAADIREAGGRCEVVDTHDTITAFLIPDVPAGIRPIVEILPVQMVSLALAALAGREPGRFELASKVTTRE